MADRSSASRTGAPGRPSCARQACQVRLHDGRHTAATLLLAEGVHPRVVMEVLGHAQMRTTTDTYSHVMPALGRDAADRMGSALWGPPAP
jgi:integrase